MTRPPARQWTPCPNEGTGDVCPSWGLEGRTSSGICEHCRTAVVVATSSIVVELAAFLAFWTCACGHANRTDYSRFPHFGCLLVRSGADVLRADVEARALALALELELRGGVR